MGKNSKTKKLIMQGHITTEWWDRPEPRISELESLMLNSIASTQMLRSFLLIQNTLSSGISEATNSNPQPHLYYNHTQVPYRISKQRFQRLILMITKEDYLQVP